MALMYQDKVVADVGGGASSGVPFGVIAMWSGNADSIPPGWQLCDGTNGTPDLRDKFVLGAGGECAPGDTGGEKAVTLTVAQLPKHFHEFNWSPGGSGTNQYFKPVNAASFNTPAQTSKVGGDQPHNNMPPYYALCYIMHMEQGGGSGGSGGPAEEIYSTEERRIGTYLGKPLYQITINGNLPTVVSKYEPVLPNAAYHVDIIVDAFGWARQGDSADSLVTTIGAYIYIAKDRLSGDVSINANNNDYLGKPYQLTLKYTKTTDEDGDTEGGPAEEIYSLEERKIGTYLGKPLYQITVNGTLPSATGKYEAILPSSVHHVDMIVSGTGWCRYLTTYDALVTSIGTAAYIDKILSTGDVSIKLANANFASKPYQLTLKYTKTTDEAQEEV